MSYSNDIIRSKSPMRVSFAGGGLDLEHYYNDNPPGKVLNATINKYAYCTLYPRKDRIVRIMSTQLGKETSFRIGSEPKLDGVMDLAKMAVHNLDCEYGMDLVVRSDAPPGSGLGGSSALTSAIIGAVAEYCGKRYTLYELSELNYKVERIDLGVKGGRQDQYATTFGGFNYIEFYPDKTIVNPLRVDQDIINDLEAHLLFCYTGSVRTDLGLIDKQIKGYTDGSMSVKEGMHRLGEIVDEIKQHLLHKDLNNFGDLLHEAFVNKKKMNPHITEGTIIDSLYEKALKHGAIGGKSLGAGGGGYFLTYAPTCSHADILRELEALGAKFENIQFENKGLQVWRSKFE